MSKRRTKLTDRTLEVETAAGWVSLIPRADGSVQVCFSGVAGWNLHVSGPHVNNSAGEQGCTIRAEQGGIPASTLGGMLLIDG